MTAKKRSEEEAEVEIQETPLTPEGIRIKDLTEKRDKLIAEIKPRLLSNSKLRSGGGSVRSKHGQEIANFSPVLNEINELGKILGQPPIGLGSLREE